MRIGAVKDSSDPLFAGGFAPAVAGVTPKMLREAVELPLSLVPSTPAAHALVETVVGQVMEWEQAKGRRRRGTSELTKLRRAVEAILGGLLRTWARASPNLSFKSLVKEDFTGTIGFRQFKAATDALIALGLVGCCKGKTYNGNAFAAAFEPKRWAGRYWPMQTLLSLAIDHGINHESVRQDFHYIFPTTPPKVTNVLRVRALKVNGRSESLSFDPEERMAAWLRKDVEAHNRLAEATSVTGCLPPRWRRTFTLDWSMHGRWYALGSDGNYQSLPEEDRLQTTIGGEPVAEIDIRASFLTLMHGLLGLSAPEHDAYEIAKVPRETVKFWVNASLGKGSPVRIWPGDTSPDIRACNAKQVAEAVIGRYPFMERPWRAVENLPPAGDPKKLLVYRLMGIEAAILSGAMDHLRGPDAPRWHLPRVLTLPMHDGLIVPVSAVERAVEDLFAAGLILGKVRLNLKVSRADGSVEYLRAPPRDETG